MQTAPVILGVQHMTTARSRGYAVAAKILSQLALAAIQARVHTTVSQNSSNHMVSRQHHAERIDDHAEQPNPSYGALRMVEC